MLATVKEIFMAASVIRINDLGKDMEWTAQLSSLSSLTTSFSLSLQMTFSILVSSCSVATAASIISQLMRFTLFSSLIFIWSFFDLSYIFCLYFLYSFNHEDLRFSFD